MFRWLFLNESLLHTSGHASWKISTLRILLLSGFVLEALIAAHSSLAALRIGAYHVVVIVALFYLLLAAALSYSGRHPDRGAALLVATVYAAGATITLFVSIDEIAKLGVIFVYSAPLIAGLFFGKRLAVLLMAFNVLPFVYLLNQSPLLHFGTFSMTLPGSHTYIHSLLFLFFNVCIPLAVFRVLHALERIARHNRDSNAALAVSNAQYQEFFENAGSPIVLCDAQAMILQANRLACGLIGSDAATRSGRSLFAGLRPLAGETTPGHIQTASGRHMLTASGRKVRLEKVAATSGGHYIVVLGDSTPYASIEQALQRSEENVSYLSTHDAQTGLPNRQALRAHLGDTLSRLDGATVLAMVAIRLNSIRLVNEQHGALVGDAYIERFASELRAILPASAFCARLRSVVFSIVLPPTRSANDVIAQVDRLRRQLPPEIGVAPHRLAVQFSTGIALARAGDTAPEDLMRRSEVALDSARRSVQTPVAMFDEADAAQISRRIEIEQGIVEALKHGHLRVVYQPKVDDEGAVAGLEALLRWRSPTLGDVSPGEFIPIAESSGLVLGLTRFVIDDCCAFVRAALDAGGRCPPVAINLSALDLIRTDLLELIDAARAHYATPAELLEFEITETGLIGNEALAMEHLNGLRMRGLRIAIDDFGTGYSSFSKINDYPVDSIKIDRSFVARIGQCAKSESIIKAIVSLTRILGCTSVAEGVENAAQERFLKAIGCDHFQGYFYYRPLEVAQLRDLGLVAAPADEGAAPAPNLAWSLEG